MGLGPATVVRLERALAHEVSPLLHSHTWVCAEGGAGYKVGRCRRRQTHRPATGMREWPSTQASSKVRESTGHGQTRQALLGSGQHAQRKPPMVNQRRWPCQATLRATQIFLKNSTKKSLSGRPDLRAVAVLASRHSATSRIMHNLWITVWRKGIRCSRVAPTRAMGSGQEEWGRTDRD